MRISNFHKNYQGHPVCLKIAFTAICILLCAKTLQAQPAFSWIRINQMGYAPQSVKVAVWVSKADTTIHNFELIDTQTGKVVFRSRAGQHYGAYGPFQSGCRLDFSAFHQSGRFYIKAGRAISPPFRIDNDVYSGVADFSLRYMRQQRSGFNPFLDDSCHTRDGYIIYGPVAAGTHIDVSGGWHDASDYLQYVTTSANATYHLLAAWRDFPSVFSDSHLTNGLDGKNGIADVLDEARWGLDWLLKMHPRPNWMFNQIADDRDHAGFRLPDHDSVDYGYGKGNGRPVYFLTGEPQGLGKYQNHTTGTASTAGKFTSAFALGAQLYRHANPSFAALLQQKALSAYAYGLKKPGVAQTAPNKAPYYYEEDDWTDDMELAAAALYQLTGSRLYLKEAIGYAKRQPVKPWMGADTARHYQWYPFHNFGHYEIAGEVAGRRRKMLIRYYREGIKRVLRKARHNAFYRGIPFIWCSNNLNTSFAIQCYLYRRLSGDNSYQQLEQACFDWLFGCNPWGKCMVYGLPADGDTPRHPHSSLAYLRHYPLDGAMVDGPVYGSIFHSLKGLQLFAPDAYSEFQSHLAVYHDDYGDYSTNEPTMDGTASLVYLLAAKESEAERTK